MALEIQVAGTQHLVPVMQASDNSLTFLMEDLYARRQEGPENTKSSADVEAWINALHRQTVPIVGSSAGRTNIKEWLALVAAQSPDHAE
jgi:hypothetical protein